LLFSVSCIARINQIIEGKKLLEVNEFAAEIDGGGGRFKTGFLGASEGAMGRIWHF
jgi:hypothetical protein